PFPPMAEAFRQWARFAYVITQRNEGPAIAVADLTGGDPNVEAMIRLGKRCGLLTESKAELVDPGAVQGHLVRFEHHRFQEYFAARHIHEEKPTVQWLDKLDAPRWQETMQNVILLGDAVGAVPQFAGSIAALVAACQAELEQIRTENENRRLATEAAGAAPPAGGPPVPGAE